MAAKTTSFSDTDGAPENIVNQVLDQYDEWGQLVKEYQAHDGEVDTGANGTPYVQYNYSGPDHGLRLESVRYPNGRILDYLYDSGIDDVVGRVSSLADSDETHLADYTYLGLDRILGVSYPEPGVTNDPILNGYDVLDRFGRTAEVLWKSTASPFTPVADLKYGNLCPCQLAWVDFFGFLFLPAAFFFGTAEERLAGGAGGGNERPCPAARGGRKSWHDAGAAAWFALSA